MGSRTLILSCIYFAIIAGNISCANKLDRAEAKRILDAKYARTEAEVLSCSIDLFQKSNKKEWCWNLSDPKETARCTNSLAQYEYGDIFYWKHAIHHKDPKDRICESNPKHDRLVSAGLIEEVGRFGNDRSHSCLFFYRPSDTGKREFNSTSQPVSASCCKLTKHVIDITGIREANETRAEVEYILETRATSNQWGDVLTGYGWAKNCSSSESDMSEYFELFDDGWRVR